MANINLMRVRHLLPELEFFRRIGSPVASAMQHAGIPSEIEFYPEAFMPYSKGTSFRRFLRRREFIDDLGWQVYGGFGLRFADQVSATLMAPKNSLGQCLVSFKNTLWRANNFIQPKITHVSGGARFEFLDRHSQDSTECLITDWTRVMAIVALIQSLVGAHWRPPKLGIISTSKPCGQALSYFDTTTILQGQTTIWIEIPNETLVAKAGSDHQELLEESSYWTKLSPSSGSEAPNYSSVSMILKSMLLPYISEGIPSAGESAEMLRYSKRTLQRRLQEEGTSFSSLYKELRVEYGQRLLAVSDMPIADIAVACGYDYLPNFSRAFTSSTGTTPSAYRNGIGLF